MMAGEFFCVTRKTTILHLKFLEILSFSPPPILRLKPYPITISIFVIYCKQMPDHLAGNVPGLREPYSLCLGPRNCADKENILMEANHILLVEDDKEIREGVEIYLRSQGYVVFQAADGIEGLKVLEQEEIHLAIVDVMMPRMDGITMTVKLREKYDFPVIILSAKTEEVDKIMGLNIGADDYVSKPFTPMELLARVNSQLRRYKKYMNMLEEKEQKEKSNAYTIGGLELNEDTVEVTVDGRPAKLTPIEFKILALLMKNPGRVFSAEEIYERVWNERAINTDTIMVHVRKIREKIEINPREPKYLKVVWGVGYKIEKQA